MRAITSVAVIALCGCSIIFDPAKAPPKGCPATPSGCPALPNAVATCSNTICQYSCAEHFVDTDGDLNMAGSNGCELDCTSGASPMNPASLVATVGAAAGKIDWTFPALPTPPAKYKLCVAPPGGAETCLNIDPLSACTSGTCAQSTTGHADNIRVTGRLVSVDTCAREGSASTASTTSATPFDTSDPSKWTHDPSCGNSTFGVVGGQLSLEQQADNCSATLVAGDELWDDYTVEGDIKFGITSGNKFLGGLAAPVSGTGYRLGALTAAENNMGLVFLALTRRLPSQTDQVMATSIHGVTSTGTAHLKLVSHQHVVSVSIGPTASTMAEVLRFTDPFRQPGKLGIAALNSGRVEVTNFRASTASELPDAGPTSLNIDFAGGVAPTFTRTIGAQNLSFGPCPSWPAAAACDGGCLPNAGSQCAHAQEPFLSGTAIAFDLPVGIDITAPWNLAVKFAHSPDAGNGVYPQIIQSQAGGLLAGDLGGWGGTVRGLAQDYGVTISAGEWHDARWRFDPVAGSFAVTIDDQKLNLANHAFPPVPPNTPPWSPHLGALYLFAGSSNDSYVTDVQVSQP